MRTLSTNRMKILATLALAALSVSCTPDARTRFEFELSAPASWKPWSGDALVVPGETLEAYSVPGPGGQVGSFVVFKSIPTPRTTAAELLIQRRFLVLNLPTVEILSGSVVSIGEREGARLDARASGIGVAWAPTGLGKPVAPKGETLLPTRRVWISVPRGATSPTLEVLFHCPVAAWEAMRPELEAVITGMKS